MNATSRTQGAIAALAFASVPDADIPAVVPNIARFPVRDLGFMG